MNATNKKLYIRVDMNEIIATGHLMRCLSIADAARTRGVETKFIVADEKPSELLKKKQYDYIVLHTKWNDMDSEIPVMIDIIEKYAIEKILIDTYQVTEAYLAALTAKTYTVYIDDLNSFVYPVNAIICYAIYHKKFDYVQRYKDSDYNTKIYEGCDYTPLRMEYREMPPKTIRDSIENVLIMSGGADPYNAIDKILESVNRYNYRCVNVVCGRYNEKYDELSMKYQSKNIHLYKSLDNIIDYMKQADLAISAGGTTLYELCACGTPTITYSLADNQLDNVKGFEKAGIMSFLGDVRYDDFSKKIDEVLDEYEENGYRTKKSMLMQKEVDGEGASRIAKLLYKLGEN